MFTVNELLDFLLEKKHIEVKPSLFDGTTRVERLSSLVSSTKDSLCWTKKLLKPEDIPNCSVLLCLPEQEVNPDLITQLVHVKEPRKTFGDIIDNFYPLKKISGISNTAEIHTSAKLGKEVYIGPGCVIGEDCTIGDNARIDANVTLYHGVKIGRNCHISSGTIIGADGFGYFLDENKKYKKIRHIGGVTIGDNVDVGANSCIDRGVLDDTVINDDVKIDNLVQIAHNVRIGKNTVIAAGAVLAGSVSLGENCWIAPGAVVKNGVTLMNEVQVGMNSVVYRSIYKPNICLVGDPAKIIGVYKIK